MPDNTVYRSYVSISRSTEEIRVTPIDRVAAGTLPHPSEHALAGLALPTTKLRGELTAADKHEAAKTIRDVAAYNFHQASKEFNETTCPVQRVDIHHRTKNAARTEQIATRVEEQYREAAYIEMGLRPRLPQPDMSVTTSAISGPKSP